MGNCRKNKPTDYPSRQAATKKISHEVTRRDTKKEVEKTEDRRQLTDDR
jgi:hypothetical protein